MLEALRWLWWLIIFLSRGALGVLGAVAIIVTLLVEGPEAYDAVVAYIHGLVTKFPSWPSNLPWGDIFQWSVAIVVVSLIIWVFYTCPKQLMDEGFYRQVEAAHHGIVERRRRRRDKRRRS